LVSTSMTTKFSVLPSRSESVPGRTPATGTDSWRTSRQTARGCRRRQGIEAPDRHWQPIGLALWWLRFHSTVTRPISNKGRIAYKLIHSQAALLSTIFVDSIHMVESRELRRLLTRQKIILRSQKIIERHLNRLSKILNCFHSCLNCCHQIM
jgi:hypothetical protein